MTLQEGLYEVYLNLSAIGAVTYFKEKYGHIPDDVQRHGDVIIAGPVHGIHLHYSVSKLPEISDEEECT